MYTDGDVGKLRVPAQHPSEVVLVAGPGGTAFGRKEVAAMHGSLKDDKDHVTLSVGDGTEGIDVASVASRVADAHKKKKQISMFIHAHGQTSGSGEHQLQLKDETWVPTRRLFEDISKALDGDPISIFMTSCYGAAALRDAQAVLPKGSVVVSLAPAKQEVMGSDVENLGAELHEMKATGRSPASVDAYSLMEIYLAKALKNRIHPMIGVVGQGNLDTNAAMVSLIGKKLTNDEKTRIHAELDVLMGGAAVDTTIAKLERGRAGDQWSIDAASYGAALAVATALKVERVKPDDGKRSR